MNYTHVLIAQTIKLDGLHKGKLIQDSIRDKHHEKPKEDC